MALVEKGSWSVAYERSCIADARVFHVETVPVKLTPSRGGLQLLGSEATLCANAARGNLMAEKWLYHVRSVTQPQSCFKI